MPTSYGGALAIKLIFVALLVGIGAAHHMALRPERYIRYQAFFRRVQSFILSLSRWKRCWCSPC
ncbi:MAG: CopD family protein [Anaerolineae bacterium]